MRVANGQGLGTVRAGLALYDHTESEGAEYESEPLGITAKTERRVAETRGVNHFTDAAIRFIRSTSRSSSLRLIAREVQSIIRSVADQRETVMTVTGYNTGGMRLENARTTNLPSNHHGGPRLTGAIVVARSRGDGISRRLWSDGAIRPSSPK